jgi:hypothetical protein
MILHAYRLKMENLEGTRHKAGAQQQDATTEIANGPISFGQAGDGSLAY